MTPSEFSEHKERDVVLVLHHRHVGVMNARSCAKQKNPQFFSDASFSHGVFNGRGTGGEQQGDLSVYVSKSQLRMRSGVRAMRHERRAEVLSNLRNGARLRALLAIFLGKAKRCVCDIDYMPVQRVYVLFTALQVTPYTWCLVTWKLVKLPPTAWQVG